MVGWLVGRKRRRYWGVWRVVAFWVWFKWLYERRFVCYDVIFFFLKGKKKQLRERVSEKMRGRYIVCVHIYFGLLIIKKIEYLIPPEVFFF